MWNNEIARYGRGYPFVPGRSEFWGLTSSLTARVERMEISPLELIETVREQCNPISKDIAARLKAILENK